VSAWGVFEIPRSMSLMLRALDSGSFPQFLLGIPGSESIAVKDRANGQRLLGQHAHSVRFILRRRSGRIRT